VCITTAIVAGAAVIKIVKNKNKKEIKKGSD
jgi:hypothetical protein